MEKRKAGGRLVHSLILCPGRLLRPPPPLPPLPPTPLTPTSVSSSTNSSPSTRPLVVFACRRGFTIFLYPRRRGDQPEVVRGGGNGNLVRGEVAEIRISRTPLLPFRVNAESVMLHRWRPLNFFYACLLSRLLQVRLVQVRDGRLQL